MLSRREFLRRTALSSLALASWGCGSSSTSETNVPDPSGPSQSSVDLAIVGAGMSGLYSAYRVLAAGASSSVAVYEAGPRVGGRLYSIPTEGIPHIPTEIGGMRILDAHPLVNNLVDTFGLPTVAFPSGGDSNLYYVRGERFTTLEVKSGVPLPYTLAPRELKLVPGDLMSLAIGDLVPDAESLTRAEWAQFKQTLTYQGRPLYEQDFSDYLQSRLSPGGYAFLHDGFGYLADVNPGLNAAEMFQSESEFGSTYERVLTGYQSLPVRLAQEVGNRGGQVHLEMPLRNVSSTAEGFELRFATGATVRARKVILAMPPAAIQALEPDSLPLRVGGFAADLQAVHPHRASRLFLAFQEPWWKRLGISNGFTRTDLPLRQCVYFGTESEQPGGEPGNSNSLLLATFSEAEAGRYWANYLEGSPEPFPAAGVPASLAAPRAMVDEALRQLALAHGVEIPRPYWAAFIDWSLDRTVAAYHNWRPGVRSWEVIPRVAAPLPGLYVMGEAFSTNQAWVEGALDNAEETLQFQLGLGPPPGVSPTYRPANYRALQPA